MNDHPTPDNAGESPACDRCGTDDPSLLRDPHPQSGQLCVSCIAIAHTASQAELSDALNAALKGMWRDGFASGVEWGLTELPEIIAKMRRQETAHRTKIASPHRERLLTPPIYSQSWIKRGRRKGQITGTIPRAVRRAIEDDMLRLDAEGWSHRQIAAYLNKRYPPEHYDREHWNHATVGRWLKRLEEIRRWLKCLEQN